MNPKISFIIPVYNGAPWVARCLTSLRSQSFQDFEAIVVNDGSTDSSVEQCLAFIQDEPRFSVWSIPHTGLSGARNVGIAKARGAYIGFLDIDDWLEPEFIRRLLSVMTLHGAEIASCRSVPTQNATCLPLPEDASTEPATPYGPCEYLAMEYREPDVNVRMGNKIYARRLFSNVYFPEGEIYEDVVTNYALCRQCRTMVHLPLPMHHYFVGNESITRSPLRMEDLILIEQWNRIIQKAKTEFPTLVPQAEAAKITALRMLADKYRQYGGANLAAKELIRAFRKVLPTVLGSQEIPPRKKLRSCSAMVDLRLYGWITDFFTDRGS